MCGACTRDVSVLRDSENRNAGTYRAVTESGLGVVLCLGVEVFGRWSADCVRVVPAMAYERARGLPPSTRRGAAAALQCRWWGILGVAVQRLVAHVVLTEVGADLVATPLEEVPAVADLPLP